MSSEASRQNWCKGHDCVAQQANQEAEHDHSQGLAGKTSLRNRMQIAKNKKSRARGGLKWRGRLKRENQGILVSENNTNIGQDKHILHFCGESREREPVGPHPMVHPSP